MLNTSLRAGGMHPPVPAQCRRCNRLGLGGLTAQVPPWEAAGASHPNLETVGSISASMQDTLGMGRNSSDGTNASCSA